MKKKTTTNETSAVKSLIKTVFGFFHGLGNLDSTSSTMYSATIGGIVGLAVAIGLSIMQPAWMNTATILVVAAGFFLVTTGLLEIFSRWFPGPSADNKK